MFKIPKQAYTAEFRTLAVQRVKGGQSARDVARELGISHQSLRNWVKADYATAGGGRTILLAAAFFAKDLL